MAAGSPRSWGRARTWWRAASPERAAPSHTGGTSMIAVRAVDRALYLLVVLALAIVLPSTASGADHTKVVTVRCDMGETIGHALEAHDGPLTIEVVGTCEEHVVIDRNDVGLVAGGLGAGIHGPDPATNTVMVTGDRFVLDGLSVTGGRNAV